METTCLTCGSEQCDNAFVYCIECLEFAVHRYCLDIIPKTLDEFVPWICDDCENELAPHSPVSTEKRDTSFTGTEEQMQISVDGPTHSIHEDSSHAHKNSSSSMCKIHDTCVVVYTDGNDQGHQIYCSTNNGVLEKPQTCSDHEVNSRLICDSELNSNVVEICNPGVVPIQIQQDHQLPAQPVEDPVWRGDFVIINRNHESYNGFVAHLSNKACSKVCEEARLLRNLLQFEMHPKSSVWPKSFQRSDPSDENIALYFFPADKSSETVFEKLVEYMMEYELALKATIKNAELLLFTSMELPLLYWRFQGRYYLWGVFRGKQAAEPEQKKLPDGATKCLNPAIDEGTAIERKTRNINTIMQGA